MKRRIVIACVLVAIACGIAFAANEARKVRIEMSEAAARNALAFLERVELKGSEVPAFNEVAGAIAAAISANAETGY